MQISLIYKCFIFLELSQCFSKNALDDRDVEKIEDAIYRYQVWVKYLLESDDFVNRKKGDRGETLLHYYASSKSEPNDKNICHLLLKYGANINCIDNSKKTALHRAVAACKVDITVLLLNHGAYVNAKDAYQNTPLHIASTLNLQLCYVLLKCGADPNIKNSFHETPIFVAVRDVNHPLLHRKEICFIVKLLLEHGGNVSIELASRYENKDVFNWCRQNIQNSRGMRFMLI